MIKEITARGPIVCGVCVTPDFEAYTGGVFVDKTNCTSLDHAVAVSGYGTDSGTPYWIVRNSWGTYWGEQGWFRIVRGTGDLGITATCNYGVPGKV